ncbi:MAG: oligosaccharide flippase family protein, partial [Gammaproteobacteria bacterium]
LFPNYAQLSRNPQQLAQAFGKVLGTASAVIVPVTLGFWAVADDAVLLVLGAQWLASIAIIKWLIFDVV